ncbi:MAG: transporter substrate-binding domain-containing protein [Pseudomonadota bacterium]
MRVAIFGLLTVLASGPALGDVLDRVAQTGEIRLGVRGDAPPFSYLGEDGRHRGLAVAICEEVVVRIGRMLDVAITPIQVAQTARTRFAALVDGETDLHCGPATATLSRRETIDFSILYFVDGATLAGRPDAYERVFEAREGRIGVLDGTTSVAVVEDLVARNQISGGIERFPSHAAGLEALERGALDLYAGDQAILLFFLAQLFPDADLAVQEEVLSFEPYALAMKRGESALRLAVDRALSALYADGTIHALIKTALGDFPLPPEAEAAYEIVGLPE